MIRIKLSKKLVLTSDSRQFILNKSKKAKEDKYDKDDNLILKRGDEVLYPIGHYGDLKSALIAIPNRVVMNSNITKIDRMINLYKKTVDNLLDIDLLIKEESKKEEDIKLKRRKK